MQPESLLLMTQQQAHQALAQQGVPLIREISTFPPRGARDNCLLRVVQAYEEDGGMVLMLTGFFIPTEQA